METEEEGEGFAELQEQRAGCTPKPHLPSPGRRSDARLARVGYCLWKGRGVLTTHVQLSLAGQPR